MVLLKTKCRKFGESWRRTINPFSAAWILLTWILRAHFINLWRAVTHFNFYLLFLFCLLLKGRTISVLKGLKTTNRCKVTSRSKSRVYRKSLTRIIVCTCSVFEKHHLSRFTLGLFNRGLKIAIVLAEKQWVFFRYPTSKAVSCLWQHFLHVVWKHS